MDHDTVFFNCIRQTIFTRGFSQSQVDGINTLLKVTRDLPLRDRSYAFATSYGETAMTMQPIREYGKGRGRKYGKRLPKYRNQVAYGRGYVQLTWPFNYEKADKELELDGKLLKNFDLALRPDIAGRIMVRGMEEGWFTGKKLSDYFNDTKTEWVEARRIINGMDRARTYGRWAEEFFDAFEEASKYPATQERPQVETSGKPLVKSTTSWTSILLGLTGTVTALKAFEGLVAIGVIAIIVAGSIYIIRERLNKSYQKGV